MIGRLFGHTIAVSGACVEVGRGVLSNFFSDGGDDGARSEAHEFGQGIARSTCETGGGIECKLGLSESNPSCGGPQKLLFSPFVLQGIQTRAIEQSKIGASRRDIHIGNSIEDAVKRSSKRHT